MTRTNLSFEEDVIDRLARMETRLEDLGKLKDRVATLEAHRSYLAGIVAVVTTVGGWLYGHPA